MLLASEQKVILLRLSSYWRSMDSVDDRKSTLLKSLKLIYKIDHSKLCLDS